jgi:predicted GNAT family acetyltransferase
VTTRLAAHPAEAAQSLLLTVADRDDAVVTVAVQTPPRKWILADAPDAAVAALVAEARRHAWPVPGVFGPVDAADAFARHWRTATGDAARAGRRQTRYVLECLAWAPAPRGRARPATATDRDTVVAWTRQFAADVGDDADADEAVGLMLAALDGGLLFVWDDGGPAAMVRMAPATPRLWRVAIVYAPPERRRRGYAGALVASCCEARLRAGARWCTLSTERANAPANALYRRLGFVAAADTVDWFFAPRDRRSP